MHCPLTPLPPALQRLLLMLLLVMAGRATEAGETTAPPDPLAKQIRVDLWGKHLGDAVSQITERSGVDLRVSPQFIRPREFSAHTLYVQGDRMTVRQAVEWICRSLGCRYRVDGRSSVWLTGGYDWLDPKTEILIQTIDPILGPDQDLDEAERQLTELVKVHSLFESYWVRIERPERKVVAALPAEMKRILREALLAMSRQGERLDKPPPPPFSEDDTALLKALQTRVVVRYEAQNARDIVADLALQSGVYIGVPARPFLKKGVPKVSLDLGEVSLKQAVEELTQALGLRGHELSPPNGIYLTAEANEWTRAVSREVLWESLQVGSYHIDALAKLASGEAIAHHIRRRVMPDVWLDPCTGTVFHPPSRNLIVVAPEPVQQAVAREIVRLQSSPPLTGRR